MTHAPRSRTTSSALASLACLGATLFAAPADAGGRQWIDDFAKAKALAAADGRDILMEFTGSDWCPPCIQLTKEVFSTDDFQDEASRRYVLLTVDNPRGEDVITAEVRAQNDALHEQFAVNAWPTIFLADADGRPYARTEDYREGGPESYLQHLEELQPLKGKRDALLAQAAAAEGVERARLLDQALTVGGEFIPLAPYAEVVDEILAADADNEAGLKMRYATRRAHDRLEIELPKLGKARKWDEVTALIADFLEKYEPAPLVRQKALFWQGTGFAQLRRYGEARASFEAAVAIDGDAEFGRRSADMLLRLQEKK